MSPIDRRGLGEIVAWSSCLVVVGLLCAVEIAKTGQLSGQMTGLLAGIVAALMGRGAQSASERSAREEIAAQRERQAQLHEDAARAWAQKAEQAARRLEDGKE
jgi:hypothetical protein